MKLPEGVTDSMFRALHWLDKHGSNGAWVWHGSLQAYRVLAQGEVSPFVQSTWLRLINEGSVVLADGRITVTAAGSLFLGMYPEVQPTAVGDYRVGRVDPFPGAE